VGFADQIFISKTDLVAKDETDALMHRLKHMNPRAPQKAVHFGEVAIKDVFDLRGFNLNAKLDIDPDFLKDDDHDHGHDHHDHHDHEHGEHCDHPSHQSGHEGHGHHHHHDDDVKSFVFKSDRPFDRGQAGRLPGCHRQYLWPAHAALQGRTEHEGHRPQGDLPGRAPAHGQRPGAAVGEGEKRTSKMVFIGIDLPKDIFLQGLEQCLV
jgi:G3E family GTPase